MTIWEYKVKPLPDAHAPQFQHKALEGELNTLGREGWEWITNWEGFFIFRRPEKQSKDGTDSEQIVRLRFLNED